MTMPHRGFCKSEHVLVFFLAIVCSPLAVQAQQVDGDGEGLQSPPLGNPTVRLSDEAALNVSGDQVTKYIQKNFDYCIIDTDKERRQAFDFDEDNRAVSECSITGKLELRLCKQGEVETYLHYVGIDSPLPDNVNCNSSSFMDGCHPGFASSIDPFEKFGNGSIDPQNPIPVRLPDASPCCRGFFCPEGLACMIPCPLGSFCPSPVELDNATGLCLPYGYEPVKGSGGLCGGADEWGVAGRNDKIFCPAKSFCPNTIEKYGCREGHYCRKGTTAQKSCSLFTACPANTDTQDLHAIGFVLILMLAILLVVLFKCSDRIMSIRHRRNASARLRAAAEAREHVSAVVRWKNARRLAKKAINAQAISRSRPFPFSRTFSRKGNRKGDPSDSESQGPFRRPKSSLQHSGKMVTESAPTEGGSTLAPLSPTPELSLAEVSLTEVSLTEDSGHAPVDSFQARLGLGPLKVPTSRMLDEDEYDSYGNGGYTSRGDGRYSTEGPTPSYTPTTAIPTPRGISAFSTLNPTPGNMTPQHPPHVLLAANSPIVDHSPAATPMLGNPIHPTRSRTGPLLAVPSGRAGEMEVMPPYQARRGGRGKAPPVLSGPITIGQHERTAVSSEDEVPTNRGRGLDSNSDSDDEEFANAPSQKMKRQQYLSGNSTPKLLRGLNPPEDVMDMYGTSPDRTEDDMHRDLYRPREAPPVPIPGFDGFEARRAHDTRSQMFKYAYSQLEKERQMAQAGNIRHFNDLMSGPVKDMLHNMQGLERHMIELEFRNLALTLKKSGKRILSGVTGKLLPGRLTAVMGPSGAGKTMFLSAIAGKETHSHMTGKVYINGREESMRAYKKIIGYVPQDDIVHADLTVEENLWFSAKYRLPEAMPKREKVLIVERTIMALGLESVRLSRVGNLKSRGISGGQRKRVNVGIEMVMEPSLLILDEPTSGLDSTSSRLVVQALQREASRGVNVVVVLHQPNYGIFRMFDDLILFAKGGRTAYIGPVEELEEYFDRLGFPVPERTNPPDHYMDVLEGIVRPVGNDPQFDPDKLPLIWARYKGYVRPDDGPATPLLKPIPQKSAHAPPRGNASILDLSYVGHDDSPPQDLFVVGATYPDVAAPLGPHEEVHVPVGTGFMEEVWEEITGSMRLQLHSFREVAQPSFDCSGRHTPGFSGQYVLILKRLVKQRLRHSSIQAQDYIIVLLTSAFLGFLSTTSDDKLGGIPPYSNTILAFGLLVMLAALRTYSDDMLTFWRECASGINRVAYFLAKDTVDLFNVLLKPLLYLSMFYFFNNPRSTFWDNYVVTLGLCYCVTGFAYIFAILMEPAAAQLGVAFFAPVATLVGTQVKHTGVIWFLYNISYARWALEGYVISNAQRYTGVWLLTRCAVLKAAGYSLRHWWLCNTILFCFGIATRAVALACLFLTNRDKQK